MSSNPASRRQLAIQLEAVKAFDAPDERLEQYSIDAEAAANLLWTVRNENPDLFSKSVLDLGCGTGVLAVGAALLGAPFTVGVDLDSAALDKARQFARESGVDSQTDWIRAHVPEVSVRAHIVVQNPPFGVKRKGSDRGFLETAMKSAETVYSIHLASDSSREYLQRFIEQRGGTLSAITPITMRIRHTLPQHRKRLHGVRAEVYKIKVIKDEGSPSSQE